MKILGHILISFLVIFLGIFLWTSECFGVYQEPFWFESFEDFPENAVSLEFYSDYTEDPNDKFFFYATPTDWQSYIYDSTDGDYSIKMEDWSLTNFTDFAWIPSVHIFDTEVETGGELFFDYYFTEDLSCSDVGFSFTYEDAFDTMHGGNTPYASVSIPNYFFSSGHWNSIQLEWYWDYSGSFIYDLYINGSGIGTVFGSASQGNISGFIMGFSGCLSPSGYSLVDNFRMYTSIDEVDPEEEPPETYDFINWADYYDSTSEKFPTSTPLFINIAGSFYPILDKMGDYTLFVKDYFDLNEASEKGVQLGSAVPKARGYLEMIDNFIGLPLSFFMIFYILTMAVVVSYKVILTIIKLLKP